jgi:hypothetical protein
MAIHSGGVDWPRTAMVVILAVLAFVVYELTRSRSFRDRVLVAALVGVLTFGLYKHAFVRHNPGHVSYLFGALLVLTLIVGRPENRRVVMMLVLQCSIVLLAVSEIAPPIDLDGPRNFAQTASLLRPGTRASQIDRARTAIRTSEAIPPEFLELMRARTVHIDPSESIVAWAYPEIKWQPLPIDQSYSAYTAHLDQLNADALASADGPELVLFEARPLDGRHPRLTSPAAQLALLCNFDQIRPQRPDERWALFARHATSSCGAPVQQTTQRVAFGTSVNVPTAQSDVFVVATFDGIGDSSIERLRSFLYRPSIRMITGPQGTFRFTDGTASSPHILRLPSCLVEDLDIYPTDGFENFALSSGARGPFMPDTYRVTFEVVPFSCSSRQQ